MIKKILVVCTWTVLLSGCWDQASLKDVRMPTVLSFDRGKENKIAGRVLIRVPIGTSKGEEKMDNEQIVVTGKTLLDCHNKFDQRSSKKTNYSQVQVMLLGEDYAKDSITDLVDSYLSLTKSSYNTQIAITEGKASNILNKREKSTPLLDEYLGNLVQTGINLTMTPNTSSKVVQTLLYDEGQDAIIPYIKPTKQKDILTLAGVALFHDGKYTGQIIPPDETELLLAYMKSYGRKLWTPTEEELSQFSFDINKIYTKNTVHENKVDSEFERIPVTCQLEMQVTVYEKDREILSDKKKLTAMNKKLSRYYTKKAEKMFATLKESKCDALGIGRNLIAYHPDMWCKIKDDTDYYERIDIKPIINVTIVDTNMY